MPRILLYLSLVFLVACSLPRKPRTNYFAGYIFTETGDTIPARIKLRATYTNKIKYKPEGGKKKLKMDISMVKAMDINLIKYGKITIDNKARLLEMVDYGKINLYAYNQVHKDGIKTFYYLQPRPDQLFELNSRNYLEFIEEYLGGDSLINEALYEDKIQFENLTRWVRLYNRNQ